MSKDAGVKIGGELFSDACGKPGEMHEETAKNTMSALLSAW